MAPRKSKRLGKRFGKRPHTKKRKTARKFMKGGLRYSGLSMNIKDNAFDKLLKVYDSLSDTGDGFTKEKFIVRVDQIMKENSRPDIYFDKLKKGFYYNGEEFLGDHDERLNAMQIFIRRWNSLKKTVKDTDHFKAYEPEWYNMFYGPHQTRFFSWAKEGFPDVKDFYPSG